MLPELSRWLFDADGLTPHGFCLLWRPGLIWLHALADTGIGIAYFAMPLILGVIFRRRPDLAFRPLVALSAAFILLCGTGHWLDLLTLWVPAYGAEGVVKAMTAVVSIGTALALWRLSPQMLALPSPSQMRQTQAELAAVQRAELRLAAAVSQTASVRDALEAELTRRRATEAALRESEERFRLLLQSELVEAIYLIGPDGTIETWNAGAERIKGYTPAEAIGQNFETLFNAEDRARGEPQRLLALARQRGHVASEGWRQRKDGLLFLASVAIDAIYREDGSLRGFVNVTLDLTKQRLDEAQRAIIVEAAPNGLMIVDENDIITLANSQIERIFGYPIATLIGHSIATLLAEEAGAPLRAAFSLARTEQRMTGPLQVAARRRDGGTVTIELMLSPVRTPRGSIVVASLLDVTERIREQNERQEAERRERLAIETANANLDRLARHLAKARDRAEQANRAKSHFLAGMSHELRTPLNAILGYAHLLRKEGGLAPMQVQRLDAMAAASRHLLEMIACALDLSEIEAERMTLRPAKVDVRAISAACLDLVRPTAEAKTLSLSLTIDAGTQTEIVVDPTRFRQILLNLLGNAVKFTNAGGVDLRVLNTADGAALRIEVRDTGPGIAPQNRERLFQDFDRLDAPDKVEGAGLGLALSWRLSGFLGGKLGHADNPGGGSIFWLELPFVATATAAVTQTPAADAEPAASGGLKVLVVDDVALNRDIAESLLQADGHRVTCVDGGAAAVAAVADNDFDVVLMDVRMPEMDGLEATRRIRALPGARAKVPIVGLTAYAFAEQVAECREAGMDQHLAKPYDPDALLVMVRHTAAARSQPAFSPATGAPAATEAPASGEAADGDTPILDPAVFERTVGMLARETATAYLRTIVTTGETLLDGLSEPPAALRTDDELVAAAHRLAGSAGMFGFTRLANQGRTFEYASQNRAAELPALARRLSDTIVAVNREIRSRLPAQP